MMFSRRVLDSLGGLERVADVLAEDWLLGKTFQHARLPIRMAPTILANVTRGTTLRGFLDRQLRWSMMRSRLRPTAQMLDEDREALGWSASTTSGTPVRAQHRRLREGSWVRREARRGMGTR